MLELTTNLLAELGGWPALKEARGLVERGRVQDARRDGAVIRARVQGAEKVYEARITLADRVANVEVGCSCAESRRSGRVCAHALAAGLAMLQAPKVNRVATGEPVGGRGSSLQGRNELIFRRAQDDGGLKGKAEATKLRGQSRSHMEFGNEEGDGGQSGDVRGSSLPQRRLPRWLAGEAPAGTVRLEITVLLPLQLAESLAKDSLRIILEARRDDGNQTLPFDAVVRGADDGFAVDEDDERVLSALERLTGTATGINAVPRGKAGDFLRALDSHPRIWLGKKQRIEARAAAERPRITISRRDDGALELNIDIRRNPARHDGQQEESARSSTAATQVLPAWTFDGRILIETPPLPSGFSSARRVVPREQIPDFLSREISGLERSCELIFEPGMAEFQMEIGQPSFEAGLEGALSGLTLELVALYGGREFSVTGKTESSAYQRYVADERQPNRFWRRNILAEREALAEVEASGFSLMRSGTTTFSLIQENQVARFLANTLPRWRRQWGVRFGPRLEATMAHVDVAQPEFSLGRGSGENWLSLDLKLSVGGRPVPLDPAEIQRWLQTGQTHARTANKRVLLVPTEAWSEMKEVLADCEVEQEPGKIRVARTFAPYLSGALAAQGFRAGENVAADFPAPEVKGRLDAKLWSQLRPYQAQGVDWLAGLAQRDFHGLLADDMGLGKTLQALAFCAWLKNGASGSRGMAPREPGQQVARATGDMQQGEAGLILRQAQDGGGLPILVVCPTSLVTNWLREAARFTPQLRTLDLTGPDRAEKLALKNNYDLLITSYAILRRDVEQYRTGEFLLVILDEAQHIKNRGSQNAQSAKALRARHRLILTGTPLENSVLDLWSLYDFLLPGYLGTAADFRERYEKPLTTAGRPDARLIERLRQRVRPFFLRRTKEEVLTELPPKLEFSTLCELTDEQREVYRAVLAQGRREVFEHAGKGGKGRDRIAVLTTLLRLRQVCCHLDLLPEGNVSHGEPKRGEEVGAEISRGGLKRGEVVGAEISHGGDRDKGRGSPGTSGGNDGEEGTAARRAAATGESRRWREPSAKMDRTFELIDEAIDGGHRVLLFSQFVRMLHLLRAEAERRELRFCYLDGQTTDRQAEVDRFQEDAGIPLFFISLKAGGTGLNLTGADTVIHFDPWWNPAVEEQATSRAHRMGQARRVQAYKLIAAGTVEEKIQALQARKRELFEASLGGDAAFVEKLTGEDLEELLAE